MSKKKVSIKNDKIANDLKDRVELIAEAIFESADQSMSRSEFMSRLGNEYAEYRQIAERSLTSLPKLIKRQGRTGGFQYSDERYLHNRLTGADKKSLRSEVDKLYGEFLTNMEKEYQVKPEKAVEDAFKTWLSGHKDHFPNRQIVKFRSSSRKGAKWQNVDGYVIEYRALKYQISFRPILTTFEVKATVPNVSGIAQAKSYRAFSHRVYLVFKHTGSRETLHEQLALAGFNPADAIGVYFTMDGMNFEKLYDSVVIEPSPDSLDDILDVILEDEDKELIKSELYGYFSSTILIPSLQ
jgi:hypothetical protein